MAGRPKPLAALSGLLVRKGQARPALRTQGLADASATSVAEMPPVLAQREALRAELATPTVPSEAPAPHVAKVSAAAATRIRREIEQKHGPDGQAKTAFTLRLDADRHLRLCLASALTKRSAQAVVTAALDQYLQALPDVDALARQRPARTKS